MIGTFAVGALWGAVLLGGAPPAAVSPSDSTVGPDHVPFVAQEPLLCGGAAGAMILRFWGARGVYGRDFHHLVREELGGITTSDLARALRDRDLRTRVLRDRPAAVFAALARGIPSILLLEGRPTLHYVVLVRADDEHVWIHDPNFGPERRLTRDHLMERWAASGRWALVATPEEAATGEPPPGRATRDASDPKARKADTPDRSRPPSATLEAALEALRTGDHAAARGRARSLLGGPDGTSARRILATSHHLTGEHDRALDHWNALSEPTVDLVEIRGARSTRHHVLARRIGMSAGDLLTSEHLRLAGRRLAAVEGVRRARLEYTPRTDGSVELRAFVQERSRWPGPVEGVSRLFGVAFDRRVAVEAGPFLASGDRWTAEAGWNEARSFAGGRVSTATLSLPGIVDVGIAWERQRFAPPAADRSPRPSVPPNAVITDERLRGFFGAREWVTPHLAVEGRVGLERWSGDRRAVSVGVGATWATHDDGIRIDASAAHWRGGITPFTRADATLRIAQAATDWLELRLTSGASAVSVPAPLLEWPGAGTGEVREPLLRGHPLVVDGAIGGGAFGRRLAHATVETRVYERFGPVRVGGSFFVDATAVHGRALADDQGLTEDRSLASEGSPMTFLDPGLGLFADTGERTARLDLARGDGRWVLSAGLTARR